MIAAGIAFLLYWALTVLLKVDAITALWVTGVIMILAGLVIGERPWVRRV